MLGILDACGFTVYKPGGAYYTMVDTRPLGWAHDVEFARYLVKEIGVAVVPGSSFYQDPEKGRTQIRFAFSKKTETFDEAERRLSKLRPRA
jgi:aminotransferase